jgi:DNA repair exonuclease SbcCD ATPase subunit
MEEMDTASPIVKRIFPIGLAAVVAVGGFGYAVHEHHAAEHLATQNQQVTSELASTRGELKDLNAKVNQIEQQAAQQQAAAMQATQQEQQKPIVHHVGKPHAGRAVDARWKKMQAQLDAQGKEIADTRGDLASAKTELGGSIARTHDELVVLEKKGQRNYFEFDLTKEKQFKREGPVGVSLRKANVKHQYADLQLMVDDRDLTQKHVNLLQPVMFYQSDSEQPIEVVINEITKNHIHGYVSAPMYRKSELASMSPASTGDQTASAESQSAPRRKLTPQ